MSDLKVRLRRPSLLLLLSWMWALWAAGPAIAQTCYGCGGSLCPYYCHTETVTYYLDGCFCSCGGGTEFYYCEIGECIDFAADIVFGEPMSCDNVSVCGVSEYKLPTCEPIWV